MRLQRRLILLFVLLIQWACHSGEAQQSGNQAVSPASKPAATALARLLSLQVKLPEKPYSQPQQRQKFVQQVINRIKALSEVESVAAGSSPPDGYDRRGTLTESINKSEILSYQAVTPEYFDVLKLNLVKGRLFEERDRTLNERLMIIS
jgi:hypothetical protein